MELVGRKWTLHVVEDLLNGPRRFTEIERSIGHANSKLITARLRELEAAGLVTRTIYAEVPPRVEYALTKQGRELRPAIAALRRFGSRAVADGRPSRRPSRATTRTSSRPNATTRR
jgi:DNA-binding HxlR family transcriptional regulator